MKTFYMNNSKLRTMLSTAWVALFLLCCTAVSAQTTFGPFGFTSGVDLAPFDDAYDGAPGSMASSTVAVSGVAGSVTDIQVDISANHTWVGDLVMKLVSPDGDTLTLVSRPGYAESVDDGTGGAGTADDWSDETLTFSDAGTTDAENMATPFGGTYFPNPGITAYPTQDFASLFGGTMNGTWTLYIGDAAAGDQGYMNSWSISIVTASPAVTLVKTVVLEDGNNDCSDDPIPTTASIGVNAGDAVCYFYTVTNTGDVEFDSFDIIDDQLGSYTGLVATLSPDSSATYFWDNAPTVINAEVTNLADVTLYDAQGAGNATATDNATVGIIPANDDCANAITIGCGDVMTGNTDYALIDGPASDCGGNSVAPDVWYSFAGTGEDITASLCGSGYDTKIEVFTGTCGALVCVVNNDDFCGSRSEVSWLSSLGTDYLIRVHGFSGNTGDYTLALTCVCNASATISGGGLACDGGTVPVQIDFTGTSPWDVIISNGSATFPQTGITTNPFIVPVGDAGVYTVVSVTDQGGLGCTEAGTGSATVTVGASPVAGFTSAQVAGTLGVDFTDTSSGAPDTWAWDFGDGNTSAAQDSSNVFAAPGTYTVQLIAGNACDPDGDTASAVVTVMQPNDLCDNAIAISCGQTLSGSNTFATVDATLGTCGTSLTTAPGVWYSWVSDGSTITLSTCDQATFDTKIGLFSGSCGALVCVDGNDDGIGCTGNTSLIEDVSTATGETYYIYVTGYNTSTGDFDLTMTCTGPVNDLCADAIALDCGADVVGNTDQATNTGATDCNSTSALGVWYSYVGTGDSITISTTNPGTDYNTYLGVTDGCGNPCVAYNDDDPNANVSSIITMATVSDSTYFIEVSGYDTETGNFELTLTSDACTPPANDDCADAEVLTVNQTCSTVSGDVAFGTESSPASTCGGTATEDVWYTFVATGSEATVDVAGSANFDAVFEVLEGTCGSLTSLECVDATFSGGTETIDLTGLTTGNSYWVRVYDWYTAAPTTTTFDVCVYAIVTGIRDVISNNLTVYPNPSNGQFVVEINGVEADVQLNVMDVTGRVVYTERVAINGNFKQTLDLNVASGTYVLQVATQEGLVSRMIQIQ